MAVIWLNQSTTNCFDSNVYDCWDETTETIIPLGRQPQTGDFIYLNGFAIRQNTVFNNTINVTICNDLNPYTNVSGGYVDRYSGRSLTIYGNIVGASDTIVRNTNYGGSSITIYGNITGGTATVLYSNYNNSGYVNLTISGNITLAEGVLMVTNANSTANIIGNILSPYGYIFTGGLKSLTVNGNIETHFALNNSTTTTLVLNGNLILKNTPSGTFTTILMNGEIEFDGYKSYISSVTTFSINGNFKYRNREPMQLVNSPNNITILNDDTFKAVELTNNTTITHLLSNYDLNNNEQYPIESDVKNGVPYAYGQKVGTFTVDYPQEAEVLKDVVYDSGNKTGKLVVLPAELISRLLNCPTIETMQRLLIAHLNPETD